MLTRGWLRTVMALERFKFSFTPLLIKWMINIISLFIVIKTIKGLHIEGQGLEGFWVLIVAGAVIGLVNAFIKPVFVFLTLPITILTLGVFTLFINALMFYITDWLVDGFKITSLWGAILGSLLFSVISMVLSLFMPDGKPRIKINYRVVK